MNSVDLEFMPKQTQLVFEKLMKANFIKNYTLIGGTALTLQIKHRISEDLDFIYDGESLNINKIKRNIAKLFQNYRIIKLDYKYQIDFLIENTKVTFFSSGYISLPFIVEKYSFKFENINIANIECITSLKFLAIAQRNTIRDYYDLYCISKYYMSLEQMINNTKKLLPHLSPITYTETLVFIDDIEELDLSNHLSPKINITKQEIAEYLVSEIKKIIAVKKQKSEIRNQKD